MKKLILTAFLICFTAVTAYAGGTLSVMGGQKSLDSGDWGSAQHQFSKAVRFDWGTPEWFANIAIDYYMSNYDKTGFSNGILTETDATTEEFRIGLRGYYGDTLRIFWGAGLADISATIKKKTAEGTQKYSGSTGFTFFTNGYWVELGGDYAVKDFLVLGITGSYSEGRIKSQRKNIQIGGWNTGLYLGVKW